MAKIEIIKGYHPLSEAINSGKTIKRIFIQTGSDNEHVRQVINLARKFNIPFQIVPMEKLNKMTAGNHQGLVAFVSEIEFIELDSLIPFLYENKQIPLLAILDEITDVRNFGAIVRSAEFLGINGMIIPHKNTADINDVAIKASAGAVFRMNFCRVENIRQTVMYLKSCGIQIISASEKGTDTFDKTDMTLPTALIFGSEEKGISTNILRLSDKVIKIPASGKISSLNVSVAAGIFFYEAGRQRDVVI